MTARHAGVPVVPDADEARRWAFEELSDPAYHETESLLDRVLNWLSDVWDGLTGMGEQLSPVNLGVVALVVLAVLVLIAFWIAGPVRRSRAAATAGGAVFDTDDPRTAAEIRAEAERAAGTGNWHGAVLDRFRAVVRSLEERALLDERAGRTAYEVAVDAAAVMPALAADLLEASAVFDSVCYGDGRADGTAYARVVALDERVAATRPRRAGREGPTDDDATTAVGDGWAAVSEARR